MTRVAIIGGGVVGLATAYYLRKRGAEVIVLDAGRAGGACSSGNAGWVVPSLAAPLPAPGLSIRSLRWLTRADSPLYIRPAAMPRLLPWLWRFWRHANARDFEAGFHAVAALGRTTMSLFDGMGADGVGFEMHERGLLFVFQSESAMAEVAAELRPLEDYGYGSPTSLSDRELRTLEPALEIGLSGMHLDGDRHVRPETFAAGLAKRLGEMGVEIREDTPARAVRREGARVTALETAGGDVGADAFVIASGAWSGILSRSFGYRLPVEAGKGYSVTVTDPAVELRHPLYLAESKIACTPFRGALRVAGTMELSGINTRLDRRRIAALEQAARAVVPRVLGGGRRRYWVGMRPIAPDGLPIVGRLPESSNVYVAAGHAMLGLTLAPSTGSALAELVLEGRSKVDLSAFDPARF